MFTRTGLKVVAVVLVMLGLFMGGLMVATPHVRQLLVLDIVALSVVLYRLYRTRSRSRI